MVRFSTRLRNYDDPRDSRERLMQILGEEGDAYVFEPQSGDILFNLESLSRRAQKCIYDLYLQAHLEDNHSP